MIDIIIAAYKAQNTIEDTLYSILMQSKKDDINVYIVNDNPDDNYDDIVKKFSDFINIKELKMKKNGGPGAARNYGIKNSKAKYIVFIDSDDMFHNYFSIEKLYNAIEERDLDVVGSSFIEEYSFKEYMVRRNKLIWNHGKIYRRKFIEDNNIYFSDEKNNEDLFFNFLLKMVGAKIDFIDEVTYVWQKNDDSITRRNNHEYRYKALYGYNNNINKVALEAEKRHIEKNKIAKELLFGLVQMYYTYLSFLNSKEDDNALELIKATRQNMKLFIEYQDYLLKEDANYVLRNEIENNIDNDLEILLLPRVSFYEFIDRGIKYE